MIRLVRVRSMLRWRVFLADGSASGCGRRGAWFGANDCGWFLQVRSPSAGHVHGDRGFLTPQSSRLVEDVWFFECGGGC